LIETTELDNGMTVVTERTQGMRSVTTVMPLSSSVVSIKAGTGA